MAPKKKKVKKVVAKRKNRNRPKKGETPYKTLRSKKRGILRQSTPMDLDEIEEADFEKLLGDTFEEVTKFQGLLLRDKQIEPRISIRQLANRYKVSISSITNAIYDDRFRSAELKINAGIFKRVLMLRHKAVENAEGYLSEKDRKSPRRFEMTKIFIQKVVDSEGSMPEAEIDGPTFEIINKEN